MSNPVTLTPILTTLVRSLDANALGENRWEKRKDIYKNVLGSFMPKLS